MMSPDLQASLLCDDVRQEHNGKFILIGLFDVIGTPNFPMMFQRFCIVNRWCSGEGEFKERTRIISPQNNTVIAEGREILLRMPNTEATVTNVEFFINVAFPVEGTYWVEILLDGDLKIRYPLRVNQIHSPRPPKPPEPPPPQT